MSVQVKSGTASWVACPSGTPDAGYVLFSGTWLRTADGITDAMLWDAAVTNPNDGTLGYVRAMTQAEIDALPGQRATAAAQAAKANATSGIDNGQLQSGDKLERMVRAVVLVTLDEINILRAAIPHRIVSITRTGNVANVTTDGAHGLAVADAVAIAGADVAAYNVATTAATVPTTTTFTYAVAGTPTTPATGSMSYTLGAVPLMQPRTTAQLVAAVKAKIAATAE